MSPHDLSSLLRARAERVYFSRLIPEHVRERDLDRRMRRAADSVLGYPDPPATFNEKIRYKILNDRRPLLVQWADKVAVRDYVERKLGGGFLTELYLATDDPQQVRKEVLPREFALKAAHGCGGCVIVGDHVPRGRRLPSPRVGWAHLEVSSDSLDWTYLAGLCREWLTRRYRPTLEWAYRGVPPKILVEELLVENGSSPPDHKLFVFHGRVRLISIHSDRFGDHRRTFYSPDWRALPVQQGDIPRGQAVPKPRALDRMIAIAEALAEETDFVRVDLYVLEDRIVVGELTSYPGGGLIAFDPASFDYELGAWWTPPNEYR